MFFSSLLRTKRNTAQRSQQSQAASRFCPAVESFDDHCLPSTLPVTSLGNFGSGTLRDAISHAQSGDVISFDPSLTGGTLLLGGDEILIDKSLTINGPAGGVTIDGEYHSRLFEVATAASVNLNFLTFAHGNGRAHFSDLPSIGGHNGYGGAILNFGSVSLSNCKFVANFATNFGGAVYTAPHVKQVKVSGSLSLRFTDVIGNRAWIGGGIYVDSKASLWAENSTVSGNFANSSGGGIWLAGGSMATLNKCTVSGNAAEGFDGGGIYNAGTLTTDLGVSVTGNSAAGGGGGIYNTGKVALNNSSVTGNSAGDQGGGIYNSSTGVLTLSNTSATGNTAPARPDIFIVPPTSKKQGRA
jgi:parallel beta-helix repeat protein/predicted outer membrane repeat protein